MQLWVHARKWAVLSRSTSQSESAMWVGLAIMTVKHTNEVCFKKMREISQAVLNEALLQFN